MMQNTQTTSTQNKFKTLFNPSILPTNAVGTEISDYLDDDERLIHLYEQINKIERSYHGDYIILLCLYHGIHQLMLRNEDAMMVYHIVYNYLFSVTDDESIARRLLNQFVTLLDDDLTTPLSKKTLGKSLLSICEHLV